MRAETHIKVHQFSQPVLSELGTELDRAEAAAWCPEDAEVFEAADAYFHALLRQAYPKIRKMFDKPRRDIAQVRRELRAAEKKVTSFAKLGSQFYTAREMADATVAAEIARTACEIAEGAKLSPTSDGYVMTRKTVLIDGQRVPVARTIRS